MYGFAAKAGLSADLEKPAKQCIINGQVTAVNPAKPYIEIATDAAYEASRGLEEEGEQEQKQEESAEESEKTSQMSDKEKEKKKEKEEQEESIFNEEQLKNIEKYGIKAENIQDYEDAMKELADMGLLKDDPETQKEESSNPEEKGASWTDYLYTEEKEQFENDKELYGLEVSIKAEYEETMQELQQMGMIKELSKDGPNTTESNT